MGESHEWAKILSDTVRALATLDADELERLVERAEVMRAYGQAARLAGSAHLRMRRDVLGELLHLTAGHIAALARPGGRTA